MPPHFSKSGQFGPVMDAPKRSARPSELDDRSQADDRSISKLPTCVGTQRVRRAPAWPNDVLKIRLKAQTRFDLILVCGGDHRLRRPTWPRRRIETSEVPIQCLGFRRNMGVSDCHADLVIRPSVGRADPFDPAIGVEIEQASVGRAVGCSSENADTAIIVSPHPVKLLLEDAPNAVVTGQGRRRGGSSEGPRCRLPP